LSPAVVIAYCHTTIVVIVIDRRHYFAAPVDGWLLFVVLSYLCPFPLSSALSPLSSTCHAIVKQAA
jgi:hypothetical protein